MASMIERVAQVLVFFPDNPPLHPRQLAKLWFSDMPGFNATTTHHNGGLRKAATCALGLCGRMRKNGLMVRWFDPSGFDRTSMWKIGSWN
jgi:hypothetical protein